MASISNAVLGRPVRRRRRASAVPSREAAMPAEAERLARTPAPPPAPERRVERVAEKARPARRAEANTIRALVIDPQAKTVKEIRLATSPGDERGGFGTQLDEKVVERIVRAEDLETLDLASGDVVVVDPLMQEDRDALWRFGDDAPVGGIGVVVGYDGDADAYRDTSLNTDEARESIQWDASATDEGDADASALRADISARLAELDTVQLKNLQSLIDEGALDEARGVAASEMPVAVDEMGR